MKDGYSRTLARVAALVVLLSVVVLAALFVSNSGNRQGGDARRATTQKRPRPIPDDSRPQSASRDGSSREDSPFRFTMMTEQSKIDFIYHGSPSPESYMTEQNGGGVSLPDYDNDGMLDLFFVNGSHFQQPAETVGATNRLYRALDGFRYEDVTLAAGLEAYGYGMGCAAGDYDNDGFTDLFVAYYGRNRLWRNNGDGTFDEVTELAGVGDDLWGTSAAFADLDGDGLLDLYVVNYVEWSADDPPCYYADNSELRIVCSPMSRSGQPDSLYRNRGDGRFEQMGSQAGIAITPDGKGLAVVIADFDGDSRPDIYVANDTTSNFLFHNLGGMRFQEVGIVQGTAISNDGRVAASMGIGCADYDRNGHLDLFVINFHNQINDVFANFGRSGFVATNTQLGVDLVSRAGLGFGVVWADFDGDRWPDLFVANGHILDLTSLGPQYEYEMRPHLLVNQRGRRFVNVAPASGSYFRQRWLGRAVACGDLDNDGDVDLIVAHLKARPMLLRNDSPQAMPSVRLELIGTKSSRQPLGARVEVIVDEQRIVAHILAGGSFQATHDHRVLVPVGKAASIDKVQVWWTDGSVEAWSGARPNDGSLQLVQGTGEPVIRDEPR